MISNTHVRPGQALALVAVVAGLAAPAAVASPQYPPDLIGRYVISHHLGSRQAATIPASNVMSDVIDRYLVSHRTTGERASTAVSDLANSLQLARDRQTAGDGSSPVSDLASSLQVMRRPQTAAVSPISDRANSLSVARTIHASMQAHQAASAQTPTGHNSFDWSGVGIGAAGALGLVLLTAAGRFAAQRRRSQLAL